MAEMLVDLKRTVGLGKSQRGWYKTIDPDARDRMRELTRYV